jgi:hypothetical protein
MRPRLPLEGQLSSHKSLQITLNSYEKEMKASHLSRTSNLVQSAEFPTTTGGVPKKERQKQSKHNLRVNVGSLSPFIQGHRNGGPVSTTGSPPMSKGRVPAHDWSDDLAQMGFEEELDHLERSFSCR